MKNCYLFILITSFFCIPQFVSAQNISNEGREFWTVFPTHVPNDPRSPATMNVNVTSKFNTEVTVSCGNTTETKSVAANTVVTFLVNRSESYIDFAQGNQNLINRGIHIKVTDGMPKIVAYSHVFAAARSAATLILPVEALGQKYYSMNYTQDNSSVDANNFMVFVATENDTDLILHKTDGTIVPINGLNKGDVYEYIVRFEDLTGTYIETASNSSCKKIAAFSGSSAVRIGGNSGGIDPLLQQLYTINSWGKTYGVVPFIERRYIVRVLAQADNTIIYFDGVNAGSINKGEYIERILTDPTIVSSDKLISVAEYSFTQEFSSPSGTGIGIGDPEMVLLNPIEFNIKNITLFSSTRERIDRRYINVFMKTDKSATFKINGAAPSNGNWKLIPSDPSYSYIQIEVTEASLTLNADDGFNAIAYGFGVHESYAYSAGTNLATSQFLLLVNKTTNLENATACIGQASDFKLTVPYELEKIIWKFDDGTPDFEESNPTPITSVNGTGTTLYTYPSPVNKIFSVLGAVQVIANATLSPTAVSCNSSELELIFNFNVDPLPEALFEAPTIACVGEEVSFVNLSKSNVSGKIIAKWYWDFGDGVTSTEENPKHIFNEEKNFTVKLLVSAENGCFSNVQTHDVLINPKPVASFINTPMGCVDNDVVFTDKSTIAGGTIIKWTWDFGDITSSSNMSLLENPIHKYSKAGTYEVKLIIETDKGCISSFVTTVTVNELPKVDFSLPETCIDAALAIFKNTSTDFNNSLTGLTYEWDFGDTAPGAINNTSNLRNGSHTYTLAKDYIVSLTVTNANGCKVIKTKQFTVNSSNAIANFEKEFVGSVCSNQNFSLKNTSTLPSIGKITRLEWYFNGLLELTDEEPVSNRIYTFTKPKFTSPQSKDIIVTLKIFTGDAEACSNTSLPQTVILLASPELEFNAINPVCVNGGKITIIASETGGLAGDGLFTGNGVNSGGIFNPIIAGVGTHNITYTFNADNGCVDIKTQTITVYPAPVVNVQSDFYILAGGEKQIDANASGIGLTYEWSPSIGLSRTDISNPIANPEIDTKYTVKVTSNQGCFTYDEIFVHVLASVNAPNTFTPNGDGINDVWNIKYLDSYPNGTIEIFDRNGQRVYFSKGYAVPFDGNYKNKALAVGTYYYIINPNNARKRLTGNLTIIR